MTAAKSSPWRATKIATSRRAAKPTTCRRCGANTLTGDDHDTAALIVTVDPHPITQINEVINILTGTPIYLRDTNGALHHRDWSAGRPTTHPIHQEHRCHP